MRGITSPHWPSRRTLSTHRKKARHSVASDFDPPRAFRSTCAYAPSRSGWMRTLLGRKAGMAPPRVRPPRPPAPGMELGEEPVAAHRDRGTTKKIPHHLGRAQRHVGGRPAHHGEWKEVARIKRYLPPIRGSSDQRVSRLDVLPVAELVRGERRARVALDRYRDRVVRVAVAVHPLFGGEPLAPDCQEAPQHRARSSQPPTNTYPTGAALRMEIWTPDPTATGASNTPAAMAVKCGTHAPLAVSQRIP